MTATKRVDIEKGQCLVALKELEAGDLACIGGVNIMITLILRGFGDVLGSGTLVTYP